MTRLTTLLAATLLVLTAACERLTGSPPVGAGIYRLDADALRAALESAATAEERAAPDFDRDLAAISRIRDSLELRIDGSYEKTSVLFEDDLPGPDSQPVVTVGTWSVRDGTLTLRQDDGHEYTLRVTEDGLEFDEPPASLGVTLRFVRSEEEPPGEDS